MIGVLQDIRCDGIEKDDAGYFPNASYQHLTNPVMGLLVSVWQLGKAGTSAVFLLRLRRLHLLTPGNDLWVNPVTL